MWSQKTKGFILFPSCFFRSAFGWTIHQLEFKAKNTSETENNKTNTNGQIVKLYTQQLREKKERSKRKRERRQFISIMIVVYNLHFFVVYVLLLNVWRGVWILSKYSFLSWSNTANCKNMGKQATEWSKPVEMYFANNGNVWEQQMRQNKLGEEKHRRNHARTREREREGEDKSQKEREKMKNIKRTQRAQFGRFWSFRLSVRLIIIFLNRFLPWFDSFMWFFWQFTWHIFRCNMCALLQNIQLHYIKACYDAHQRDEGQKSATL